MKIKSKIKYKEIIKGLSISLLILVIISSVGYGFKNNHKDIWASIIVTQFGFSIIWIIIRSGLFSVSGFGARKFGNTLRHKKNNKLGVYKDKKLEDKKDKKTIELNKNNPKKSNQGIYLMIVISFIELISTIWIFI